jgi:hypothetical protein
MIPLALSLALLLQPTSVLTLDIDPTVAPIVATRLRLGEPAPSDGAFLDRRDWLRARSALRALRLACDLGVSEAIGACVDGIERDRNLARAEAETLKESNRAYATRLEETQTLLSAMTSRAHSAESAANIWMWIGVSALSASTLFTVFLIVSKK